MGLSGACRSDELYEIRAANLNIADKKTYLQTWSFMITNPAWINIVEKYFIFVKTSKKKFFLSKYVKVKWQTNQPIGHNSISQFPRKIATFLKFKEETYTGHCLSS